ncbi:hypothetical protein F5I97DRAFT_722507 [Phlebopus sp. FC_14]|nr:hypothetical protein F5I97DRAFT_722507 [Phlebopus sp. FC_14]
MSWKNPFQEGVACFKRGSHSEALAHMDQAITLQSDNFTIYDSRAAVHEKLGNTKAALLDSKKVIDLAPDRWQGYARSARLFYTLKKYGPAVKMVDYALSRLRLDDIRLHARLLELRDQSISARNTLEKQQQACLARNSYFLGKLPVEILVHIFDTLISYDHTLVIKLSHVCNHWRRIIIDTPFLWHTLVISDKHPVRKANTWLQRSKSRIAALCFSASLSPLTGATTLPQLKSLSWGHLSSLHISQALLVALQSQFSDLPMSQMFSNLRELTVYECSSPLKFLFLNGKWKLKILRLGGIVYMEEEWWQHIQQLTELHLSHNIIHFSNAALMANPQLESLVLDLGVLTNFGDTASPPHPMSSLRNIEFRNVATPRPLLHSISAPSITSLHIFNSSSGVDDAICHLINHERSSLLELRIGNCSLSSSAVITVLDRSPCLESLQLYSVQGVANDVLEHLAGRHSVPEDRMKVENGLRCPSLKHVDVSHCSDLLTGSVYRLVKSRLQDESQTSGLSSSCCKIESLRVDGCPNLDAEMLSWFRSKVAKFSCVYMTKKEARLKR